MLTSKPVTNVEVSHSKEEQWREERMRNNSSKFKHVAAMAGQASKLPSKIEIGTQKTEDPLSSPESPKSPLSENVKILNEDKMVAAVHGIRSNVIAPPFM